MTPLGFLRMDETRRVLARAATAAASPVAIHFLRRGEEGPCISGMGQSAACRYVHQLPGGAAACRKCRIKASSEALRDGIATPFLCHMGFACVAAPLFTDTAPGFVMVFGPYCPVEAPDTLTEDARNGLAALGDDDPEDLNALLCEVRLVNSGAITAIVEWTADSLNALWQASQSESDESSVSDEDERVVVKRKRPGTQESDPLCAAVIAAALAGGDQREVRSTVLTVLSESPAGERTLLSARRARAMALVGAVIEAAERAKFAAQDCWGRLPEFIGMVSTARTNAELATAVTGVLRVIRRRAKQAAKDASLEALNNALLPRLGGAVTLNEIAAELGEPPSTITRRLQRKFGMSFSEYAGKQRVDRAKRLLRTTRLGIGEVSRRVGINDSSNFAKLFRRFEGCSPQTYRERFGKKP